MPFHYWFLNVRLFIFLFASKAKQAKEWSKGKSFEHYVTSISQTLVSITSLLSHSRLFLAMIELHVSSQDLSINHQVEKEGKVSVNPQVNNIAITCHHHLFALLRNWRLKLKGRWKVWWKNLLEDGKIKGWAINHTSFNSLFGLIYMCLEEV